MDIKFNEKIKEIPITDIEGIRIGHAQDEEGGTGCTVFIVDKGAPCGLDVRGGGPASRESELLKPTANADVIHAVLLSGGSAFGLDAAGGVMRYLEEHGIGFAVGNIRVPLVCQSDIFDLMTADPYARPNQALGYEACVNAEKGNYRDGNYGVGNGATVGKLLGMDFCMKTGIGSYAVQAGDLKVGAVVVVNALGDVYDWKTGREIAGLLDPSKKHLLSSADLFYASAYQEPEAAGNTTLAIILTNAKLNKTQLIKTASLAHNGLARAIRPVHTSADGDSIYAMSLGDVESTSDMVGTLAADVLSEAVLKAVTSAESKYGFPSVHEIE